MSEYNCIEFMYNYCHLVLFTFICYYKKYLKHSYFYFTVACDHRRAYYYFIEAVLNPKVFLSKKCEDWDLFVENKCETMEVALGNLTTTAAGKFYFKTANEKPFSDSGALNIFGISGKILFSIG